MKSPNTSIGVSDARTHLSKLLNRVESGEAITITRHIVPIARLVPVPAVASVEERQGAIQAIRDLGKRNRFRGLMIKQLISEGRR